MSEPLRIALVGATGLIGGAVIEACTGRSDIRLTAIARREVRLPEGARMDLLVAEPVGWERAIAAARPHVLVCALGTTWRAAGKVEAAFRAVDEALVLECARAARAAGATRMVVVSSVGADLASRTFYLRVKGEVEAQLGKLGFARLDIVRPGLLTGARGGAPRVGERMAMLASPFADVLLHGQYRRYRSIGADVVARAILGLSHEKAPGKFVHEHDALLRAARRDRERTR